MTPSFPRTGVSGHAGAVQRPQPGFQQCLRSQLCGLVLSHRRRTHPAAPPVYPERGGHQEERVHDDDAATVVVSRSRTYDSQIWPHAQRHGDPDRRRLQDHAQGRCRGILRKLACRASTLPWIGRGALASGE
ncbi:hypothetical protein CBG40_21610 [Mycobacterium tuberculosis]